MWFSSMLFLLKIYFEILFLFLTSNRGVKNIAVG